ncbi:hypothetical protein K2173_018721 [Erythroxylum novogranatense]|uniref:Late embryogenesis abundant protein LEA-2 subgroup domain-containing protein n=1 Tax=Erythroxylum novogranatense TaxID=1862640 RepID=A0AAV8SAK2_9ROSI|nr:hypothetical protein K2173_018721 [Erythroxylum novogranatense]
MAIQKAFKVCCAVTAIFIIVIAIIFTTLALTVFKPKNPDIQAYPVGLDKVQWGFTSNVTIGMVITIGNRNYGSFQYKNTSATIQYHGLSVGEVAIPPEFVPARSKINITTSANLMTSAVVNSPYFSQDVSGGNLTLTSTAKIPGKVHMFNFLNMHAVIYNNCKIDLFLISQTAHSTCFSQLKL